MGGPSEKAADAPAPEATAVPGSEQDQIQRWRGVIDRMRLRTDLAAKGLGAIGTTALAAVGIAKVADLFPFPDDADRWTGIAVVATVGGFMLMAAAVAAFTIRLTKVSSPVFTSSRPERIAQVDVTERRQITAVFDDMARLNGAPSLWAYEARAHRLDRIAERVEGSSATQLHDKASTIRAEVLATQGHAAADVIRSRATRCLTDLGAKCWYATATVGLICFGTGADYLDGERTGRSALAKESLAVAKECAAVKATSKASTLKLPADCSRFGIADGQTPATETDGPAPAAVEAEALQDLATRHAACVISLKTGEDPACGRILTLLRQGTEAAAR